MVDSRRRERAPAPRSVVPRDVRLAAQGLRLHRTNGEFTERAQAAAAQPVPTVQEAVTERPIERFPGYLVTDEGAVIRVATHQPMKPQLRAGYHRVKLSGSCGMRHWMAVHKLVLEAFIGPRPTKRHHGAHGDRNRANNRLKNLRWALPEENEADKKLHGTARTGPWRRLTLRQIRTLIRQVQRGAGFTETAKRYGVHRSSVSRIVRRAIGLTPTP